MRRIILSALAACPALTEISAAAGADPAPFAPKTLALAPDTPPQFPMPEKFGGEPLPSPDEKAALVQQTLQLTTPPPAPPDEAAQRAKIMELFSAIADGNQTRVNALLDQGLDPDTTLPRPADPDFVARFDRSHLHYFVTVEQGVTPLMLAAGRGDDAMLRLLLARGASPKARTKRHKTFPLWLAGKGGHIAAMQTLLGVTPDSDAARTLVEIDLATQTATLIRDGAPLETVPVSTGRQSFPTRAGEYVVTDKHRKWRSTLYPADMPYFMRLSCGEIGLHQGNLPGYPASHGCIRLRQKDAAAFFKQVPVGTKVVIK